MTFVATTRMPAFCVILAGAICLSWGSHADAQLASMQPSICIFNSKSYSEGAMVCAGRVTLGCTVEANRPLWRPVKDEDAAGVCQARGRMTYRPRRETPQRPAAAPRSDKCFSFNGRTYCE